MRLLVIKLGMGGVSNSQLKQPAYTSLRDGWRYIDNHLYRIYQRVSKRSPLGPVKVVPRVERFYEALYVR